MEKYGLVLAGGGAKGAYQLGAWKAMRELGISFEAVAGVSIGSINGALIAADDYGTAVRLWQNVSVDKGVRIEGELPDPDNLFSVKNFGVLLREFVKNGGIDASPTESMLREFINEDKVRASGIFYGLVTIQLSGGMTPRELTLDDIPEGELVDYLMASAHIPGVSNIGPEGETYLDGGLYDNAPCSFLRKNGYNRLIVVDISSVKGYAHSLDINNANVVYIRPYDIDDLGASFDFSEEMTEKRMTLGYKDTKKAFSLLLGNIFYFEPDVFKAMVPRHGADCVKQLEQFADKLGVDRQPTYTYDEFMAALLEKYKETSMTDEAEEEVPVDINPEPKAEGVMGLYSQIRKIFTAKKREDNFSEAISVLEQFGTDAVSV
ncbi:MAG: patatin-like phospholipase family protein [Clostridia bacterium]|nr:patatin-like phospholipase family protein [Clostridia bacterium]